MSDVLGGVVWAVTDAKAKANDGATTKHKGSVANMSLGGGKSPALDDAINKAVKAGLHFAVAAGQSIYLYVSCHTSMLNTIMGIDR